MIVSYDEKLAARIRKVLAARNDVVEKKMFGGLCFMVDGAMCCGLTQSDFMVRVGPAQFADALARPHTRPMDFTGRPSKSTVYVGAQGLRSDHALAQWIARGLHFLGAKAQVSRGKRSATKSSSKT
jgi:TfoX/Sxy family transcriptional regulator of competence genes